MTIKRRIGKESPRDVKMNRMTQDELEAAAAEVDDCMVTMLKLGESKLAGEMQEVLTRLVLKYEYNERTMEVVEEIKTPTMSKEKEDKGRGYHYNIPEKGGPGGSQFLD